MYRQLRSGDWLTADRIRAVATVSLALGLLSILYLLVTSHGTLDAWGRPLGTDFSDVWTAGQMALDGRAPEAWNWAAHYQVQQAAHGDPHVPFYGWHYPPPFLLLAAPLAALPYLPSSPCLSGRRLRSGGRSKSVAPSCPARLRCSRRLARPWFWSA
jgi:hypothetical protein